MLTPRSPLSQLLRRPALVAALLVALVAVLPASASAAVSATSSVNVKDAFRGKNAQQYVVTVNNTSTAGETLGSVQITRPAATPADVWSLQTCAATGWLPTVPTPTTGAAANQKNECIFTGPTTPIPAGGSAQFTVTANVSAGDNMTSSWGVQAATSTTFTSGKVTATAAPAGALDARAWTFEITKAILSNTGGTVGLACPADNRTAPAESTQTIVVCGFQRSGVSVTPVSSSSSLVGTPLGTMISSAGLFASGSVATGTEVVLANYSGSTVTSSAGTGKTIDLFIGSSGGRTSPSTLLTGYSATQTTTALDITSATGTYGGNGTLVAALGTAVAGKSISFSLNGSPVGSASTNASGVATLSGVSLAGINAGTVTNAVSASFAGDPAYTASNDTADLVVAQKAVTATADNKTRDYGTSDPAFTFAAPGLETGDALSGVACGVTGAHDAVGTYDIVCSGNTNTNYDVTYAKGTLTVQAKSVTVTADNKTRNYKAGDPAFTYTAPGVESGDPLTGVTCGVSGAHVNAGSYSIACSGNTNPNYTVSYADGTLTVNPKPITVKADDKSKTYGAATDPTFTFTPTGLESGDSLSGVSCGVSGAHVNAGAYVIACSGNTNANYAVTYQGGTLTVNKKPADVTADNKSKTYDGTSTYPSFTFGATGLETGDGVSGVTCGVTGTHSNAGVYDINCSADPSSNPNYDLTFHKGTFTINKKAADVTADNKAKTYGAAEPAYTFGTSGLVTGESLTGVNCGVLAPHANVGTYDIDCAQSTGSNPNYDLTFHKGVFTVNAKAATVTADNKSKTYGAADPGFTHQVSGLESGDTLSGVSCGVSVAHANAAAYDIVCSGSTNTNYNVTYVKGTLTVNPKAATVTAGNKSKTYGQSDPAFTFTPSGLESGDSLTGVSCGVAAAHANAGSYDIDCAGNTNANYNVSYVKGTLTVNPKAATATADNKSKTYGQSEPAFTFTPSGLESGDSLTGVTCGVTGAHVNVGSYDIDCSGSTNSNYNVSYVKGTYTVTKKAATVTADDKSKTYGSADPAFTHQVSGLESGDSLSGVTCNVPVAHTNVGVYDIVCSGGTNSNYDVSYVKGTFTVADKAATVTADDKSKTYGSADPAFTHQVSGLESGDSLSNVTCTVPVTHANVGTYDIVCSGNTNADYAVSYVKGTLTVTQKALTGSFTAPNKVYDGTAAATISGSSLGSGVESGDDVTLDASHAAATFASKAVGTGKTVTGSGFALAGAAKDNYTLSVGTATASITAKSLTGGFTAADKVYDGTTGATVTARSVTGKVGTDAVDLTGGTAAFGDRAVGTGKTVTLAGASLSGADAGNYSLASVSTDTADVTAKPITGGFRVADKDYDGTTAATITVRALAGVIAPDAVSLVGGTATFADPNPGTGKTVVPGTGFSLTGADSSNYSLASVLGANATIRQRDPGDTTPPPPTDEEMAADALDAAVTALKGLTFGGLASAFVPEGQTNTVTVDDGSVPLAAVGGCESDCAVGATGFVDLGKAAGASAAKSRKLKLKAQRLTLKAGQYGVLKLKLSKKQRKLLSKARRPKLTLTITVTQGARKVTQKKTWRLKTPKKR